MKKLLLAFYGLTVYVISLAVVLYAIAFVGNCPRVPGIDSAGLGTSTMAAIAIDVALLGVFALQHSVMARPAFKQAWTRIVPPAAERSTFVLAASAALGLLMWQWRALPLPVVWDARGTALAPVLLGASLLGWGLVIVSTYLIDHLDLFGLRQSLSPLLGWSPPAVMLRTPLLYRHVRHPLYLGFLIAFWATPALTAGHLLFAATVTAYTLAGIGFEERDLVAQFGARYVRYRERTGKLLPRLFRTRQP